MQHILRNNVRTGEKIEFHTSTLLCLYVWLLQCTSNQYVRTTADNFVNKRNEIYYKTSEQFQN